MLYLGQAEQPRDGASTKREACIEQMRSDNLPLLSTSIDRAVRLLRSGGVIATPTDTLYGIAANALDARAVERVYAVKGRSDASPLPILVGGVEDLFEYGADVPDVAVELARAFWPGQLTIVAKRSARTPSVVSAGLDTVGMRVADHPVTLRIVAELGAPITATSANVSGAPPLTSALDVVELLGDRLDMVLDGGKLPPSKPSTVIDAVSSPPRILREGAVSRARIERVAGGALGL